MKHFKRTLALLLAAFVLLAGMPLYASAADLTISTAAQLKTFLQNVAGGNTYSGKTVELSADVDLAGQNMNGVQNNANTPFSGTFDGKGYAIKNFTLTGSAQYNGLFRYVSGTNVVIKNLNFDNVNVNVSADDIGALAGYVSGTLTVNNVHVRSGSVSGSSHVGGLIGQYRELNSGALNMNDCSNVADVSGRYVGGLVGYSPVKVGVTLIHCYNIGTVTSNNSGTVGGLFGYFLGDSGTTADWVWFQQCFNAGKVSGGNYDGGIIGYIEESANSEFDQCFNWGNVSSNYMSGGIFSGIGDNTVENGYDAYINNLYNAGNISAGSGYAYDIGWSKKSALENNCYNCGTISASNLRKWATQYSTSLMQNRAETISSAQLVTNTWGVKVGSTTYFYPIHNWYRNMMEYTLNFVDNGSGTNQTITKIYNDSFTAPNASRTGYTTGDWKNAANASDTIGKGASKTAGVNFGTNYVMTDTGSGPKYTATYDLTWTANQYTVTLNADGGTGGTASVTATYDAAMPAATMPGKTGYSFGGYYDGENGAGTKYYSASGASAHKWDKATDATLLAQWTIHESDLKVDPNGGKWVGYTEPQTYTREYGEVFTLGNPTPPAGYHFVRWELAEDANGTFDADTGEYTFGPEKYTTDFITAIYEINNYRVVFKDRNGSFIKEETVPYGGSATPPEDPSTYIDAGNHYYFDGWSGYENITDDTVIQATFTAYPHVFDRQIVVEKFLYRAATCLSPAKYHYSCECGLKDFGHTFEVGERLPHTMVEHPAIPATCTANGNTAYWHCTACNNDYADAAGAQYIQPNSWIENAKGHNPAATAAKDATCTEAGNSAYWYCDRCEKYFSDADCIDEIEENSWVTEAKGHNPSATAAKEATCTEAGNSAYWYCDRCEKYFSDAECGNEIEENSWVIGAKGHNPVATEAKAATCTEAGNSAYWYCDRCEKYFSDAECGNEIEENSWVIGAKGHNPAATAAKEATCTEAGNSAYWYCDRCEKYFSDAECGNEIEENSWVIEAKGHTPAATAAKEATCTEAGNSAYWYCDRCEKYFSDAECANEIEENSWVIEAIGHDYEASWTWAADNSSATVTLVCKNDASHKLDLTATVTHTDDTATETEGGEIVYTATAEYEGKTYTDTKTVETAPLGHTHVYGEWIDEVPATCENAGTAGHYVCSGCGKYFDADHNEITDLAIPAKGHVWNAPVIVFSEDGKTATASRTCKRDAEHVENAVAAVSSAQTKAPTCTAKGETTYTAAVVFDGVTYTDTKVIADVDMLAHEWSEPVINFSADGKVATASRTCSAGDHTETKTAAVTSGITKAATCTAKGETTYTATVVFDGETYSDTKTVADVKATGHSWDGGVVTSEPTCTGGGTVVYSCANCDETKTAELAALGHDWGKGEVTKPATTAEEGERTYTCSRCGETKTEKIAKSGACPVCRSAHNKNFFDRILGLIHSIIYYITVFRRTF